MAQPMFELQVAKGPQGEKTNPAGEAHVGLL